MIGTEWKLRDLKTRCEWNERTVRIVDKLDDMYFKIHFINDEHKEYKIHRKYLISKVNAEVTPDVFEQAMVHLMKSSDDNIKEVVSQIETGRFEEAKSNAAKWSLKQLKKINK